MHYRRSKITGGTFFFTLVTYQRKSIFSDPDNINLLHEVIREVKSKHPFKINSYCILPDHLHTIWTLPSEDKNFSMRWRLIKSNFTKKCASKYKTPLTPSRALKAEQCIWQRRYWEHQIRDDNDLQKHIDYIHYNPVKHGYIKSPMDWMSSSFKYYVDIGVYTKNWGAGEIIGFKDVIGKE